MSFQANNNNNNIRTIFQNIMAHYFIFIVIFLMLVVFLFAYKLVISPVKVSINSEIKIMNENKKIQKLYLVETLKNINKYKEDYLNLSDDDKKKIEIMIPNLNDSGKLFTDIELLVSKKGFILNSLEISSLPENKSSKIRKGEDKESSLDDEIGTIILKLDVSNSSYKNFKKLLDAFENNLRILDVSNIGFSLENSSITCEIKTYYFKKDVSPEDK